MSTYTKRADGRYMATIMLNGTRKYIYANTKKELDLKLSDMKINKSRGTISIYDNITFKQYAEKWFKINCSTKEFSTQSSIKNRLKHLYKYIGNIKLKDLKRYHIQEMVTNMVKEGYTDMAKRTLAECKRILNDALNNDVIFKNVANGVTAPKFQKNERMPLTQEQDKKVLEMALNHKYGLFILILRYCGLRPEEAVALTVNDVDFQNKKIIINKAVSLAKNQPVKKATKNLKNRKIPIPDFLIDILLKRITYCNDNKIEYIFTKETDNYSMLTKQALKTHLNSFLNALNKEVKKDEEKIKFSYYQLRHSYCTMLYYADIKIKKAQELMGHSSADMVYDIYTHLDEERENAEELINNYINKEFF